MDTPSDRRRTTPSNPAHGERQRSQILGAAVGLISERGVDSVRLRDVATAAGVSVGMIQHYFDSRDQLVVEAFRRFSEDVVTELRKVTSESAGSWEKLSAVCKAAASTASVRKRSSVWLDLVAVSARDRRLRPVARAVYEAWFEAFYDVVSLGVTRGEFDRDVDPVAVSEQLVMLVDGLDVASAIRWPGATRGWRADRLLSAARKLLTTGDRNGVEPGSKSEGLR